MTPFLKSLGKSLYERVFLSYKSTLIAMGFAAAILVADQATTALSALPQGWAKIAASVIAVAGALLKSRAASQPSVTVLPPAP